MSTCTAELLMAATNGNAQGWEEVRGAACSDGSLRKVSLGAERWGRPERPHFSWIVQTRGSEVPDLDGGRENREEGARMNDTVREGLTGLETGEGGARKRGWEFQTRRSLFILLRERELRTMYLVLYVNPPGHLDLACKSAGFGDMVLSPFIFCSQPPSLAPLAP